MNASIPTNRLHIHTKHVLPAFIPHIASLYFIVIVIVIVISIFIDYFIRFL